MKFRIYQHLRAPNDINGNPRRVFVVYEVTPAKFGKEYPALGGHRNVTTGTAEVIAVHDEGYSGRPASLDHLPCLAGIPISAKEYRDWLGIGRDLMDAFPWSYSCTGSNFQDTGWFSRPAFTREDAEAEARSYLKARQGGTARIYKGKRRIIEFKVTA